MVISTAPTGMSDVWNLICAKIGEINEQSNMVAGFAWGNSG